MSTSLQLAVGMKLSHQDISSRWLRYNNNAGYYVHLSQNVATPKARFLSVCYTAPTKLKDRKAFDGCKAHIKAVGTTRDKMQILSLDLNHTSNRESNKRKRNYLTKEIAKTSEVLQVYEPAPAGSAKQFQSMTKAATGINIKKGQANAAVKSKCHDSLEAQIGQYFLLPSLLDTYEKEDPEGTFIIEYVSCH
jgi:hypothetical protein